MGLMAVGIALAQLAKKLATNLHVINSVPVGFAVSFSFSSCVVLYLVFHLCEDLACMMRLCADCCVQLLIMKG